MAQYLLKGMKLLENFTLEELHRARFIKAYGVLKNHQFYQALHNASFFLLEWSTP